VDFEKDDMELSELFRKTFENAEVLPDPSVNVKLMGKLARREFLSFNPGSFNIYYLGGLVAAGLTAAVLLLSDKEPVTVQNENNIRIQASSPVTEKAAAPEITEQKPSVLSVQPERSNLRKGSDTPTRSKTVGSRISDKSQPDKTTVKARISANEFIKAESVPSGKLAADINGMSRIVSSVSDGCVPLKVGFINASNSADSCKWSFGDGGTATGNKVEWIYDVDGEYKVIMEAFSNGRLVGTSTTTIKVYPVPSARFEIHPEKPAIPDDEIRFINYSADAVRYLWNFGDGEGSEVFEPLHRYDKYNSYNVSLVAINEYGCTDSIIVMNAFAGSKYFIDFPNAFIPNPDGPSGGYYTQKSDESAQVFHPIFMGVMEYQLKIFSKMGILIFESNDVNIGWDGYFNGQLSNSGVYIWKVRGKYRNGQPFTMMGDVTLLKY